MTENPRSIEPWPLIPKSEHDILMRLLEGGSQTATELKPKKNYSPATVHEALSRLETRQFVVRSRTRRRELGYGRTVHEERHQHRSSIMKFYSLTFEGFLVGTHSRLRHGVKPGQLERMIGGNAGVLPYYEPLRTLFREWPRLFAGNRRLANRAFKRAVETTFSQLDVELRLQDDAATPEQREDFILGRPWNLDYLHLQDRFAENLLILPDTEGRSYRKEERRFAKWMKMLAKSQVCNALVEVMWRKENERRRAWEVARIGTLALGGVSSWTQGDENEILSRYPNTTPPQGAPR